MEAYLGECLNVMMKSLHAQDGTLPPGLMVQNTYMELRKGSKKAVVVVRNQTVYPQTLWKKIPVVRMIPAQLVPEAHKPDVLPDQDETCQGQQTSKLTIRQRRGKLFNELDLSGLNQWAPEMVDKACQLLMSIMTYSHWIQQS